MNEQPQTERAPVANDDGVEVRPILETLSRLRGGRVLDLMSLEVNRVVKAIRECGDKGGKVTLTLDFKPLKKFPDALEIVAEVNGKPPKQAPGPDLMFYDDDGNLHTRNPNQRDIFERGPQGV